MDKPSLFTPPRLFSEVHFHRHTQRSIAWLELFFDLIYVATFIQIGNFLSDNVSVTGFAQFAVLLAVVWWSWTGATFFQNRYFVDDVIHRLMVFVQIFAVASLGLSVSGAFGDLYAQFTLAYVVTRLMLVLMYIRSARSHPETARFSMGYAAGFSVGIVIWLGSLFLPADYHWVGWLLGTAVELTIPALPAMRNMQREVGTDLHHMSERFGIFTIILLGEAFIKILDDSQGVVMTIDQILFSISGLIILCSLWWLYFQDNENKTITLVSHVKPLAWIYGHLPLATGLVAFGVGAKKLFAATVEHPADPIDTKYRLLYTTAVVLYLAALALINIGLNDDETGQNQNRQTYMRLGGAIIIAILGVTITGLNAFGFVTVIAAILVVQILSDIYVSYRKLEQLRHVPDAH